MRKASLSIIALLVAVVHSAPPAYPHQQPFAHVGCSADRLATSDDGITYLPPNRGRIPFDLDTDMRKVIESEMQHTYNSGSYIDALRQELCLGMSTDACELTILSEPRIEIIPTKQISDDIYCSTATCTIGYEKITAISTTHSVELGFSAEVSAKPFGMGMSFTASTNYGFSHTKEESVALSYQFNLERGEAGYIAMVNAQVSARVRRQVCVCHTAICAITCSLVTFEPIDETAYHESVILKDGRPRSIVSFVFTSGGRASRVVPLYIL
ncbi:MAG: hypothetical protein J3Q66DRAFT_341541 [Benniella sp.]|nr:MAG: hypothetical protein J3Q66DRAFT_341541 [Benniella sp.]